MKVKVNGVRSIPISGEFIRLDSLLKYASVASTGGEAKMLVKVGEALIGGEPCMQRGRKVRPGDVVRCCGQTLLVRRAQ